MAMIPIKKMRDPDTSSGKCYPVSVFECIYNTSHITVANDIGAYKKGDIIPAETKFSEIFHNIIEVEAPSKIITDFKHNVSDETVPSSKLTKDQIDAIFEILGIDEEHGLRVRVKTNEDNIEALQKIVNDHTISINEIWEELDKKANIEDVNKRFDLLDSKNEEAPGRVTVNEKKIKELEDGKQDKLVWLDYDYEPNSNKAVTAANLINLETELTNKFSKVTNFRDVIIAKSGETNLEAIERVYQENKWQKKNGDIVIIGKDEYIYASADEEWHELGNTDGFIKSGTGALTNKDFSTTNPISQDYISGLVAIQNNVNNLIDVDSGVPNLKKQVSELRSDVEEEFEKFKNYTTTDASKILIDDAKTDAITESKNYTDTLVGSIDVEDSAVDKQFVTKVSQTNGVINVSRKTLDADDIPDLTLSKITDSGAFASIDSVNILDENQTYISGLGNYATKDSITVEDIPELTMSKISDAGKYATVNSLTVDDIPTITMSKIGDAGKYATANSLTSDDIPSLTMSKISDAGELATKDSLSKSDIGLENVDNTSDVNKPISTAVQEALNLKEDKTNLKSLAYKDSIAKSDIGLENVDNTADIDKPVSTAVQTLVNTLKFTESDTADLSYNDGITAAIKAILIKLGMSESNITI